MKEGCSQRSYSYTSRCSVTIVVFIISFAAVSVTANWSFTRVVVSAAQDTVQLTVQHSTSEHAFISMAKKNERRK